MNKTETRATRDAFGKNHLTNWRVYAAAAGASLSMATSADASIIHQSLNINVTLANDSANANTAPSAGFDLFGDPADLVLQNNRAIGGGGTADGVCSTVASFLGSCHPPSPRAGAVILEAFGNGGRVDFFETSHGLRFAEQYAPNALIGAGNHRGTNVLPIVVTGGVRQGMFGASSSGFVGFETQSGDLGWMRIVIADRNHDGYPDEATIVDYAYNNVAGTSIRAGDTGVSSTPEPGTAPIALLAAGAAGILALRRRRKEAAAQ